jgi:7-cyano-7-deazaguanine synthase in queuosine biosynthesis
LEQVHPKAVIGEPQSDASANDTGSDNDDIGLGHHRPPDGRTHPRLGFVAGPATARRLDVAVSRPSNESLRFDYRVDGDVPADGVIRVDYPCPMADADMAALPAISVGVATFLGQLCLAPVIDIDVPAAPGLIEAITPIAEMLYDVRRWKDDLPLGPPPTYLTSAGVLDQRVLVVDADAHADALLWSGGKDSTLAALLLKNAGRSIHGVHASVNQGVEHWEAAAVAQLSTMLEVPYETFVVDHPQFLDLSTAYAQNWNDFPRCNTVPFGRDLLLPLLASPVARRHRSSRIVVAHDGDCRVATVSYEGKTFARNDVESAEGSRALNTFLGTFVAPGVTIASPVEAMSELAILRSMLLDYPEVMRCTAFCFWGGNCGRCAKCLRYYLAQRVFGVDVLSFAVNPLAVNACPELDDMLDASGRTGLLFQDAVLYCLGRLAQRRDFRSDEVRLSDFARDHLSRVEPRLDRWELMLLGESPGLPRR